MPRSLWDQFRSSPLWRSLRRVSLLRSALYFTIELRRTLAEKENCAPATVDRDFRQARDPWKYESDPKELDRFRRQEQMLRRYGPHWGRGLEIGCAEGRFTETLAGICESLLVLDISGLALDRARARCAWSHAVRFESFDLRVQPLHSEFDLIVVAGVLEYFPSRGTLQNVREKLVAALAPGGCLLIETTRVSPVVEDAVWSRWMPRGRRVNDLIGEHPHVETVATELTPEFSFALFRKRP